MDALVVLTSSYDGTSKIWSCKTGECLRTFSDLAEASSHQKAEVGRRVQAKFGEQSFMGTIRGFSNDGTYKVQYDDCGEWQDAPDSVTLSEPVEQDSVMSAVFSSDGSHVLTADFRGVAKLWCVASGACVQSFLADEQKEGAQEQWKEDADGLYSAIFSPDGQRVLTASASGKARLWRVDSGACEWSLQGHTDIYMRSAIFSPDGTRLLTCSADCTARLWRFDTSINDGCSSLPEWEKTLVGHDGWVNTAIFSSDGELVLTAAADMTAKIWQTSSGRCLDTFWGHTHYVRSAVFSPGFTQILTSSSDWSSKLWCMFTGRCLRTFHGHRQWVNSAIFSPDGVWVLTSSRDYSAKLWRADTGDCMQTFYGHELYAISIAFQPDLMQTVLGPPLHTGASTLATYTEKSLAAYIEDQQRRKTIVTEVTSFLKRPLVLDPSQLLASSEEVLRAIAAWIRPCGKRQRAP